MGEQQRTESAESHDQSYVRLRSFGNRKPSRKVSSSLEGERKWFNQKILPDAWPRQGHPRSGFHRMSKSVKGIEARRAQTKMTSESMMRLISNLLLQLALFVLARFSSSYHQSWSSMASAASRAMPGSRRRKFNWFRPFGW